MKTTFLLLSAAASALAQDTSAEVIADNPPGARYIARFDGGLFLSGRVLAGSDAFGLGTTYHVSLSGLPEESGPFNYHIHEEAVPEGGDCEGTGGHLDPYGRTDDPPCDDNAPETCEVGDLSGKHGPLEGSSADLSLHDLYTSLNPDDAAFIGNRSVVIHAADGSRLACANFAEVPAEEDPVEETPIETPTETAPDDQPEETESESAPSETPSETAPDEVPSETAAPEEPEDDDECEAEEPEESSSSEEPPAETSAPEPPAETEEPPRPTVEAPSESDSEEAPAETTAAEEAPAEEPAEP